MHIRKHIRSILPGRKLSVAEIFKPSKRIPPVRVDVHEAGPEVPNNSTGRPSDPSEKDKDQKGSCLDIKETMSLTSDTTIQTASLHFPVRSRPASLLDRHDAARVQEGFATQQARTIASTSRGQDLLNSPEEHTDSREISDSRSHGSIPIALQHEVTENTGSFRRWSSGTHLEGTNGIVNKEPVLVEQHSRDHLRQPQRGSILEYYSGSLVECLDRTIQDLANSRRSLFTTSCRLQSAKYMIQERDQHIARLTHDLQRTGSAINGVYGELKAARELETVTQARIKSILHYRSRSKMWLKMQLIAKEKAGREHTIIVKQQDQMLEDVRSCYKALYRELMEAKWCIEGLKRDLSKCEEERKEDSEALKLSEREVFQLTKRLKAATAKDGKHASRQGVETNGSFAKHS